MMMSWNQFDSFAKRNVGNNKNEAETEVETEAMDFFMRDRDITTNSLRMKRVAIGE